MKFKVGDRVLCVTASDGNERTLDMEGEIVGIWSEDYMDRDGYINVLYSVEFDNNVGGHDCDGLAKDDFGWNVKESELIRANSVIPPSPTRIYTFGEE